VEKVRKFLFSSEKRLLCAGDFKRVFHQGKRLYGPFFTVICCENGLAFPRLGLIVAKRHVPRAVTRNLIRRVVRESFRLHQTILPCVDIVVMLQRKPSEITNDNIRKDLAYKWKALPNYRKKSYSKQYDVISGG